MVLDVGPGIAPEQLSQLFERFSRRGNHSGGDLGLFIVKGIIKAHGGDVSVVSEPGKGASFTLTLPAAAPVSAASIAISNASRV